jgi:hypothetical protein
LLHLEIKETTDTASSASFLDLYLEFDDSGQLSTKIYNKRDDFNFKIINFQNMCSNIAASPAYGVYISQLICYARASSNYSWYNSCQRSTLWKRSSSYTIWFQMRCWMTSCLNHYYLILIFIHFPYLLYENPSFIIVSAETEYFSTRSWYRNINFFKRSNKANLFIALFQRSEEPGTGL